GSHQRAANVRFGVHSQHVYSYGCSCPNLAMRAALRTAPRAALSRRSIHPLTQRKAARRGFVGPLLGSIRRECVEHIIVLRGAHLRWILKSYARYYNETRTHLALDWDTPVFGLVRRTGAVRSWADFTTSKPELEFSVHTDIAKHQREDGAAIGWVPFIRKKPSLPGNHCRSHI